MDVSQKLLARTVVLIMLLGMLPAFQPPPVAAQDTATYNLTKYDCAPGYDPGTGDANSAFANCTTPAAGVSFTLASGDASYGGGTQQTNGGGSTGWSGIPLGTGYSVSESLPPGYGNPWVYCEVSGNPNNPGDVQRSFFQAPGGSMDVGYTDPSLTAYTQANCTWFNVPPADQNAQQGSQNGTQQFTGGATVTIQKFLCEDQLQDYGAFTLADYGSTCTSFHEGVNFSVNGGPQSATSTGNGIVEFGGLAAGQADIRLHEIAGYVPLAAYCVSYPTGGGVPPLEETHKQSLTDEGNGVYRLTTSLQDGYTYNCAWFDYGEPQVNVYVYKYVCDQGYDWTAATVEDLLAECISPQENVTFEVRSGSYSRQGTTDVSGVAVWAGVPSGEVEIEENVPAGYQVGRVFCNATPQNSASLPSSWNEYAYSGGVQVELPEDQYLHCYVFDVPHDGNAVYVSKYNCPDGFDWENGSRDYLVSGCTEPGAGINFQLRALNYQSDKTTDSNGFVSWDDAPLGTVALYEQVPEGYAIARIFCGTSSDAATEPSTWEELTYDGGLTLDIVAGQVWYCTIFDAPTGYGTIVVHKYDCPIGFDWQSGGYHDLIAACTIPHEGVMFDLNSNTTSVFKQSLNSGSDGMATWEDVPQGSASIFEHAPTGYLLARVFCGTVAQNSNTLPGSWEEYQHTPEIDVTVPAGEYLHCTFFNVPDGDYGAIVVTKYMCNQLALPGNSTTIDYSLISNQCTQPWEGFEFTLVPGGSTPDRATDTSGTVSWNDLEAGTHTLTEVLPAGSGSIGAWCTTSPADPTSYTQYAFEDELSFDYQVEAGVTLYCNWYNWEAPSDSYVTITKYICEEGSITVPNPGYRDYQNSCHETGAGWKYSITGPNEVRTAVTNAEGVAILGTNEVGALMLSEQQQPGYRLLAFFCRPEPNPTDWFAPAIMNGGGVFYWQTGDRWVCDWFNERITDHTPGYPITITKYNCDVFFTRGMPARTDYEEHCTEPAEGVEFRLYSGMDLVDSATTDASGMVTLTAPTVDQYQIAETPVDGYLTAAVYCADSPAANLDQPELFPLLIDVIVNYPVTCVWYNAPDIWDGLTEDPGSIVIQKYNCPPGFQSDDSTDFEVLLEGCTLPAANVSFSANQGGNQVASGATNAQGEVALSGATPGLTRISELPIEGWDPPLVFCGAAPTGIGRTLVAYDRQTVTSWGIEYDIPADSWLSCFWFDRLPYAGNDGEPIQIIVHKYLCESGIETPGATYAEASAACTTPEEGVNFDLTGGDGGTSGGPTDVNGYAEYNGVAPGSITIAETPRDGYQTGEVFCSLSYGATTIGPDRYPVVNESIQAHVAPGYTLECYWYNVVEPEVGHVYVFKYICPEGSTYSSYDDLSTYCTERHAGVTFTLTDPTVPDPLTRVTSSSGLGDWYDVPVGDWTLTETPYPGYEPSAVYCGESGTAYIPPATVESKALNTASSSIEIEVKPDTFTMCYWYNVEAHDEPQVWFYKYNCHEGASWHWSYHKLLAQCATPAPGVEFAWGQEGGTPSTSTTDDQGRWRYDTLSPGVWYWEEHFPAGYSGAVVYCQWADPNGTGEYQKAELDGARLWLELEYDQVVTCYWFDFPDGHTPPSPTPHPGSGTAGTSPSGSAGGAGGSAGGSAPKPPVLVSNIPTGPVGGGTPGGATTQPADPNAPATLVIVKLTCPEGYDIYDSEADVEEDCDELTEGIEFALTDLTALAEAEDDEEILPDVQLTDEDGEALWSDLAAGPYLLVEALPADTQEAFIWTCESDLREFQIQYPLTPFTFAGPDGQVGITLIPGETLECSWYNVPVAPGSVTVYLLECPTSPVIIAQCSPAPAGIELALGPVDTVGPIIQLVTDDEGKATGEGAGSYMLMPFDDSPCLMESDALDENGSLVLGDGEEVEFRIYTCGGGAS
jgi:hypothetical protein